MKIGITMNEDLVSRLDKYAKSNFSNRSAVITSAVNSYLNANETFACIKEIALSIKKIADNGTCSDEELEHIEDLQRFCEMLVGSR